MPPVVATRTEGKGVAMPIMKEMKLVSEVIVIDTAASEYVWLIRSGIECRGLVRRQAANNTKASSMPTPGGDDGETIGNIN